MAELLKHMYNRSSLYQLAQSLKSAYPAFCVEQFLDCTMDETWEGLELKARVRKISTGLGSCLPADYRQALAVLDQVVSCCPAGFSGVIFPDFVELYGQGEEDWDVSIAALERYTPYSSSEFAVRPFIISQEQRMMAQMYDWSKHENEHVRRLSSEGCRPQLPWGQALVSFKKDPTPVLPILQQLKCDPSLYVRKSVANNLNDISKTHPDLVLTLAEQWYGEHVYTDWILKHGCRTLLKKGNRRALALFGYDDKTITVEGFQIGQQVVILGETLTFSFCVTALTSTKVRLEYGIDYVKANGIRNRKIFQIAESVLQPQKTVCYSKNHAFVPRSTRKHYPGNHAITLIVNGEVAGTLEFELVV